MLPEPTIIVLTLFVLQGLTATIVAIILRRFYLDYQNNYFRYWYWSWLAMIVYMFGSAIALNNAFTLPQHHPFRLLISTLNIAAALTQFFWLFAGSYELGLARKFMKRRFLLYTALAIPISCILSLTYINNPELSAERIFLRVGVKSLVGAIAFVISAILIYRLRHVGVGMKIIFVSFLLYGIEQFNNFITHFNSVIKVSPVLDFPYYIGVIDLFIQALMGMGMIVSMLEVERHSLTKANRELDTFLYRSSHDLRAPLTTISGLVAAMKNAKEKEQNEFLESIEERVEQADNVIRDIITLRKGQMTDLFITNFDVKEEIEKEFNAQIDGRESSPKLLVSTSGQTTIHSDLSRLHIAFANLLSNAIKYHNYNQEEPTIEVRIEEVEHGLSLTISDNGPGIAEKHLPKIFDMFYRANRSSFGSGLGLYLVKDAIDKIQGTIGVQSESGKGTTFDLFIKDLV